MDKKIKTIGEEINEVYNAYFNKKLIKRVKEKKGDSKNGNILNTWNNSKI